MIKETIDLKLLHYFVVTAETLSFTAASTALEIPKSVLSKGITKLESEIGAKVFERSSRVVRLTEAGSILFQRANILLDDAQHLLNDVKTLKNNVSGQLNLAAPPDLGRIISQEIIAPFLNQWPDVSISLKLSYKYENLFKEGLDLAFRIGSNRDDSLIEKPLGMSNRVIVASPEYLAQHPKIKTPADLLNHKSVQFYPEQQQTWTLTNGVKFEQVTLKAAFQCSDLGAVARAACGGVGLAKLPWLSIQNEVKSGKLVPVLPNWLGRDLPISMVYREGYNKPAKLAEFLVWVEKNKSLFDLRFKPR